MNIDEIVEKAADLKMHQGYNCTQAVTVALAEESSLSEEQLKALGGGFCAGRGRLLVAHDALVQAAGQDVLVGDTVINVPVAVVVGGLDGLLMGFGNIGLDDRLAIDVEDLEGHVLLGAAIHLSSRLNHVDFLVATHSGNVAVVLDADEQVTAAVVGKGGYRAGYLARIGNLILEVLMLMLALENQVLYIMAFLGFH